MAMNESMKRLVSDGAMVASLALFTDSANPLEWGEEFLVLLRARKELLEQAPYKGRPLFALMSEIDHDEKPPIVDEDKDSKTYSLSMLELARGAVVEDYGVEEARLYGEFIVACVTRVAASAGGGLFGTGEEFSEEEREYVSRIEALFGIA